MPPAKRIGRVLFSLPPLVLLLAGLVMLAVSPFAWGAARHVDIPAWMTTFAGVCFALPAIVIGLATLLRVLERTNGNYEVLKLHLAGGGLPLFMAIAEVALALRIADPATYDALRDEVSGETLSPGAFLVYTLLPAAIAALATGMMAYIYAEGFQERRQSRFDKRPGEVDAVGELLRRT